VNIQNNIANNLPFKPDDWVKVIKKPENAIAIKKGDIVQAEQVNPKAQLIRISDPEVGWEYLRFDEVELTLPPPEPVVTGTTSLSSRERQRFQTPHPEKALSEIKEILSRLHIEDRKVVIEKLMSSRDDIVDNGIVSAFNETPKIIWRSPGGRDAKYPWFECGKLRAYIGGGDRHSPIAQKRVALVQQWINEGIPPSRIYRLVKAKNFPVEGEGQTQSPRQL
jgi:hypothetical protein